MTPTPRLLTLAALIALLGAGCFTTPNVPRTAEQLATSTSDIIVPRQNGFGTLPSIPTGSGKLAVTLNAEIPPVPGYVTVIRLRRGTPNDIELRNLTSALGIPTGVVSNAPTESNLALDWTDDQGRHWIYHADDRSLDFSEASVTARPFTVTTLPQNDQLISNANGFLIASGISSDTYRAGVVDPDWNNWWLQAKAMGYCMDTATLTRIHAIGTSEPLLASGPPPLPLAASTTCVTPEFPSRVVVRYHALVDQRDVVTTDARSVDGIDLVLDTTSGKVIDGHLNLYSDPDRSDYPAITAEEAKQRLLSGGLSKLSGSAIITQIDFASLQFEEDRSGIRTIYLIPSLFASGQRTASDGTVSAVSFIVPLVK